MQNQINTTPITQLIQQIRAAELSQQKEVKMSIQQARLVSLALAEIMDRINQNWETLYHEIKRSQDAEVISITMDGGGFEESE